MFLASGDILVLLNGFTQNDETIRRVGLLRQLLMRALYYSDRRAAVDIKMGKGNTFGRQQQQQQRALFEVPAKRHLVDSSLDGFFFLVSSLSSG